jgi:hypothetical protein
MKFGSFWRGWQWNHEAQFTVVFRLRLIVITLAIYLEKLAGAGLAQRCSVMMSATSGAAVPAQPSFRMSVLTASLPS